MGFEWYKQILLQVHLHPILNHQSTFYTVTGNYLFNMHGAFKITWWWAAFIKKKKNITKSSQPNGYAATEWIMDLCSCILQILRNFQPPLGFFLITSIFSCLSGVVVGVLIQSNERRDNDPPFFCYPAEDPRHWAIIGAGRPVLSGDLCWFLGKMELWYFLWSLDDELPLSHRYW